jgi:hypothetical protein
MEGEVVFNQARLPLVDHGGTNAVMGRRFRYGLFVPHGGRQGDLELNSCSVLSAILGLGQLFS